MFPNLVNEKIIAIDTETFGLEWMKHKVEGKPHVFGVALSVKNGDMFPSWYFDIRETPGVVDWLKDLTKTVPKWINHNIKYDVHSLRTIGVDLLLGKCDCTMIRACLIDEHLHTYNLDDLCQKYLKRGKESEIYTKLAELFGGPPTRKAQMENIHKAPCDVVRPYAVMDSELAFRLWLWQEGEIEKQELELICDLESRLFPHIVELEWQGIRVDEERANMAAEDLTVKIDSTRVKLDEIAGFHVNPNPSGSIKELFKPTKNDAGEWVLVDGTVCPATGTGAPSINAEVLRSMVHPAAELILSTRKMIKTRDTFIKGHILSNVHAGHVYPNINQTKSESGSGGADAGVEGTGTGRFSYTRPALQQIPARDRDVAEIVRPIFLPDAGDIWSYGDLDQHEFRIFAHYAKPKALLEAYQRDPDLDIHQKVADMTGLPRNAPVSGGPNAKQLNLACVDGETEYLSPTGFKRIDQYDGGPVGQYRDGVVEMVTPLAYIETETDCFYCVRNGDMMLSPDHRVVFEKKQPYTKTWKVRTESAEYLANTGVSIYRVPCTWTEERCGMRFTDDELRLLIAIQADGSYHKSDRTHRSKNECMVAFKKKRKILRLIGLLKACNTKYTTYVTATGHVVFYFKPPQGWKCKSLGDAEWYNASISQRQVILDEVKYWDGCNSANYGVYYNTDKDSADFIQWAACSTGVRCTVGGYHNKPKKSGEASKYVYRVLFGHKRAYTIQSKQFKIVPGGKCYCFSVPSTLLIFRRNGRVYVSGNCVFVMGAGLLAKKMNLPCHVETMRFGKEEKEILVAGEEALEVMETYYREIPGVREMARKARTIAKSRGYVRTLFGRHIRFPGGQYTHKASGLIYQGTSADLNKDNVIRICEYLKSTGSGRLLLNIHDEYSVSLPKDSDWRKTLKALQALIQDRPNLRVPIRIDFNEGRENWWEATKAGKAT